MIAAVGSFGLPVLGQPGSVLARVAAEAGVPFVSEGFPDRRYDADGRLVPRSRPDAVLVDPAEQTSQIARLVHQRIDTLCIHGDDPNAVANAEQVRRSRASRRDRPVLGLIHDRTRVLRPGFFTTVQDQGRAGYRAFGVPGGGAFDAPSAALANALLGNPSSAAVLEMTLDGGVYEPVGGLALACRRPSRHAFAMSTSANRDCGRRSRHSDRGRTPRTRSDPQRPRGYLAVDDGSRTPLILDSRSTEIPLRPGELLPSAHTSQTPTRHLDQTDNPFASFDHTLRLIDGPDTGRCWKEARSTRAVSIA